MNLNNYTLLIRADASNSLGIGHIMRNIPIGQVWKEKGGEVTFISSQMPNKLEHRLINENFDVIKLNCIPGTQDDAMQTVNIAQQKHANCLIVDGYYFKGDYQKKIKEYNLKLIFIDDFGHSEHYYADIILNRSLISNTITYANRESYTNLLLGHKYNALRKEFAKYDNISPIIVQDMKEILVTFGGADPQNITLKIIENLNRVLNKKMKVNLIIGSAYKYNKELNELKGKINYDLNIHRDVNDMADFMFSADIAITAGGTALFEMAYMGLPSIVISIASNQKSSKVFAEKYGTCIYLGDAQNMKENFIIDSIEYIQDSEVRSVMSTNGQKLIDGKGSTRLLNEIIKTL